ncbi:MAG: hypothetical protein GWN86_17605 [Desulfobacterales bacterium]|nr:hypothetical protein [Desulfobacterales bacterium]
MQQQSGPQPERCQYIVALVKWGRREKLERLLDGELLLSTQERFRQDEREGIGDRHESCAYSY